jgi:hypothetical protein
MKPQTRRTFYTMLVIAGRIYIATSNLTSCLPYVDRLRIIEHVMHSGTAYLMSVHGQARPVEVSLEDGPQYTFSLVMVIK